MPILLLRKAVSESSAPAWFTGLAHKEWTTPVSNWLGHADVRDPLYNVQPNIATTGHKGIIEAYCGMGADQTRKMLFLAGNGGHADYGGNEVYSCDLTQSSPAWIRRRNATEAEPADEQIWEEWPDNTPPSDHTGLYQVEAEGRWFKLGLGSPNWIGSPAGNKWWEFNPINDSWIDRGNSWPGDNNAITGCALFDPVNRHLIKIRGQGGPAVTRVNVADMTIADQFGDFLNTSSLMNGAIDYTNRIVAFWDGADTTHLWFFDLDDTSDAGSPTIFDLTASGTPPRPTFAMHWHAPSAAFLTWNGDNGGLLKLTPTIGGNGYSAAAWSAVGGTSGTAPPGVVTPQDALMYNKINMIRDMGNGQSALIVVPRYADPDVYVMRLTGAV